METTKKLISKKKLPPFSTPPKLKAIRKGYRISFRINSLKGDLIGLSKSS